MRRVTPSASCTCGPRDLEVVVVLGVDRGERGGVPGEFEVLQRGAGGVARVVPTLERGDHHRVDERGYGVVGTGARLAFGHRTSLRRQASGARDAGPAGNLSGCPANLPTCRSCRPTPACSTCSTSVSSSPTARWAPCCRPLTSRPRRLRRPRGLQRDPQRHPAGRRARPSTAPTSRPARTPWRRTPSARTWPTSPSTASRTGSSSWPRRARGSPARSPTSSPRRTGRGSCSARSDRAPSCPRWATRPTRGCATPTPSAGRGLLAGGVDAMVVETCQDLLQAKAAVLGAQRAMARRGPARPDHRPGDRRDHRHDAARLARSAPR